MLILVTWLPCQDYFQLSEATNTNILYMKSWRTLRTKQSEVHIFSISAFIQWNGTEEQWRQWEGGRNLRYLIFLLLFCCFCVPWPFCSLSRWLSLCCPLFCFMLLNSVLFYSFACFDIFSECWQWAFFLFLVIRVNHPERERDGTALISNLTPFQSKHIPMWVKQNENVWVGIYIFLLPISIGCVRHVSIFLCFICVSGWRSWREQGVCQLQAPVQRDEQLLLRS